jgi:hypothetical protein
LNTQLDLNLSRLRVEIDVWLGSKVRSGAQHSQSLFRAQQRISGSR